MKNIIILLVIASLLGIQHSQALFTKNGKVAIYATSSAVINPAAEVHMDFGTGSNVKTKYTMGTDTGQQDLDGFDIGIATSSNAYITQWEAKDIIFGTSGAERARIDLNGNVGIGSASPQQKLTVTGNGAISGSVGVGLTSPSQKIHQDSGTGTATYHQFTADATTGQTAGDGFIVGIDTSGNAQLNQQEALPIVFSATGVEAARITPTGTVVVKNKIEFEDPDSGTAVVAIQASESITVPYTLRLPAGLNASDVGKVLSVGGVIGASGDIVFAASAAGGGNITTSAGASSGEWAQFSNGAGSNCDSSPCTINARSSAVVSSITRTALGSYTANFSAGTFSAEPFCACTAQIDGTGGAMCASGSYGGGSATTKLIRTYSAAATLADARVEFVCFGVD